MPEFGVVVGRGDYPHFDQNVFLHSGAALLLEFSNALRSKVYGNMVAMSMLTGFY